MLRAADKWFAGYMLSVLRRPRRAEGGRHLCFCLADHFEPFRGGVSRRAALDSVRRWADRYPKAAGPHRDSDGRRPRHTFFYPQEAYDPEVLELLAGLCRSGNGEVEVHLHHRDDTASELASKLTRFRDLLRQEHGLLGHDAAGRVRYGFIHGNWALCNSRPDGAWCGVNEELAVLLRTGCYADFTFPSAPSPTQPRTVNAIYRAVDRPRRPRGHDSGRRCRAAGVRVTSGRGDWSLALPRLWNRRRESSGVTEVSSQARGQGEGLMLIQGPLAPDWRRRKLGLLPRLENGALTAANPPTRERVELWVRQGIHVAGRPEWVFVKVHAHGCLPVDREMVLGEGARRLHEALAAYADGEAWQLHYVTAREMYNLVRAAEDGCEGAPAEFRDYEIDPPPSG